jgi:hypothetical protein
VPLPSDFSAVEFHQSTHLLAGNRGRAHYTERDACHHNV